MNDEIIKLEKECINPDVPDCYVLDNLDIEAFYRAAFNAGLEAAAKVCEPYEDCPGEHAAAIRALEMEP